jgi:hypothetical protein
MKLNFVFVVFNFQWDIFLITMKHTLIVSCILWVYQTKSDLSFGFLLCTTFESSEPIRNLFTVKVSGCKLKHRFSGVDVTSHFTVFMTIIRYKSHTLRHPVTELPNYHHITISPYHRCDRNVILPFLQVSLNLRILVNL